MPSLTIAPDLNSERMVFRCDVCNAIISEAPRDRELTGDDVRWLNAQFRAHCKDKHHYAGAATKLPMPDVEAEPTAVRDADDTAKEA